MWKTEHFLFRWTLWVLTQIYSKTRVYWNCLSQSIWKFLQRQPIPTHYLPEMLRLILKENFFHFNGKHYLQNHGTAMGTKTAVLIPLPIFSWHILKQQIIEQASLHHLTTEFTTETFDTETAFLDTVVYKGTRFKEKSILDAKTHFKQTKTFLHTHFTAFHPPNVKKRICQRRSLENPTKKLLRNNLWGK